MNQKLKKATKNRSVPLYSKLLNKYSNVKEIFEKEKNNHKFIINISNDLSLIIDKYDLNNISSVKKAAVEVFETYNPKNIFYNCANEIIVSKSGINESMEKIFNNRTQRSMLYIHFQVFSNLGEIIENAKLVSQALEIKHNKKEERQYIHHWNYYFDNLFINNEKYSIEFEVRTLDSGENHYRIQRIKKALNSRWGRQHTVEILPPYELSACIYNLANLFYIVN